MNSVVLESLVKSLSLPHGYQISQLAVMRNHHGTVEALLKAGAYVNQPRSDTGATPLVTSANNRNGAEFTKALLVGGDFLFKIGNVAILTIQFHSFCNSNFSM